MNLSHHLKKSFTVFAVTITIIILLISLTLAYFISLQENDAVMINKSGRQRMLSQSITKQVFYRLIENKAGLRNYTYQSLIQNVTDLEEAQKYLVKQNNEHAKIKRVDSTLLFTAAQIVGIKEQINKINKETGTYDLKEIAVTISKIEAQFLNNMEFITLLLQKSSSE